MSAVAAELANTTTVNTSSDGLVPLETKFVEDVGPELGFGCPPHVRETAVQSVSGRRRRQPVHRESYYHGCTSVISSSSCSSSHIIKTNDDRRAVTTGQEDPGDFAFASNGCRHCSGLPLFPYAKTAAGVPGTLKA